MHEATRLVTTVTTDGRAFYVASSVPVGKYTVSAALSGFKKRVPLAFSFEDTPTLRDGAQAVGRVARRLALPVPLDRQGERAPCFVFAAERAQEVSPG